MKIYIAGKITGDQGYQAKFRRAAAGLRMCGNIVLNPAELPLEELPNGLLGKVVRRKTELRGEWQLAFESPLYYFVCSVCGTKALDQIHGDAVCGNCHAKMTTRWTREVINDEKETSG